MGSVNDEQKKYFTAVLRGMLNLGNAKFRYGCTGVNLDYLARGPLWEMGQDFNHGTGHGVGYLLNVHEGPNSFRWRIIQGDNAVLEEGMITIKKRPFLHGHQFRNNSIQIKRYHSQMSLDTMWKTNMESATKTCLYAKKQRKPHLASLCALNI